ncbi:MAG: glycosyltransferase [Planctomycetes bacterium]|nr:glycosyltransferase [Planctomycetota bacterium]
MRIARVLTRLNLGGPARQALASDPLLAARGHELRLYTGTSGPGEGDLFETLHARGLDVRRVPGLARGIAPAGDLRALATLRREFREFQPELVHTHTAKAGILGRRAARVVPGAARVHTFHGHVFEGYFPPAVSAALVALERKLARQTDRIAAVSHATAEDLLRLEVLPDESKLVVVPPGIELDALLALRERHGALRAQIGARPEDFVVGVIGRLAPVKRSQWAVDVFELLAVRYPALQLVFIGDGSERGMLERRLGALAPQLRARAHMLGARMDMTPVHADLDAVLLCSHSEGLPIALIEAGAAGKPVVATSVGGVPELVAHERTGFLGEKQDELAFGLAQLLENRALGPAMGQRARLRIDKRHSAAALCERLEGLYALAREVHACGS